MQDQLINNSETKRKLASVQVIETVNPIPGADRIEIATMIGLGWQCVIKKGEAKPGDKIVYFECDSILPEKPEFEFLREVKFRVKIRKFKKQIAEGLIMPLSILPVGQEYSQGTDVTEILSITKHDPEAKEENEMAAAMRRESPTIRFLMGFAPFRYVYLKLNSKIKGNWPDWIAQTDEPRCISGDTLIITESGEETIREICQKRINLKVLSYNFEKQKNEFQKIIGFNVEKDTDKKWLKITTQEGNSIIITSDHRVYIPSLKCYREAKYLNVGDVILSSKIKG